MSRETTGSGAGTMIGLAEAAVLMGVPYPTAHRALCLGNLRGEKRGGRWFVFLKDVNRLREGATKARPSPRAREEAMA